MKTLLKTLFLAMAISFTANALADSYVAVSFFKADPGMADDGAPIANGSTLSTGQDFFVALINTNPAETAAFYPSDSALGNASDILIPNFPTSLTFVHPGYDFTSCYYTSYDNTHQPTQPADPTHPGYLGADGNRSFCLVRLHYAPTGTPSQLTVEAQSTVSGSQGDYTIATLNLS